MLVVNPVSEGGQTALGHQRHKRLMRSVVAVVANASFLPLHLSFTFTAGRLVSGLSCSLEEATVVAFSARVKQKTNGCTPL